MAGKVGTGTEGATGKSANLPLLASNENGPAGATAPNGPEPLQPRRGRMKTVVTAPGARSSRLGRPGESRRRMSDPEFYKAGLIKNE